MTYFYAAIFIAIGLILIFALRKENKIFILAGGFFIVLGGWWLLNEFMPFDMFAGEWGWALRIISCVVLAILVVYFARGYFQRHKQQRAEKLGITDDELEAEPDVELDANEKGEDE